MVPNIANGNYGISVFTYGVLLVPAMSLILGDFLHIPKDTAARARVDRKHTESRE